MRPMKTYFTVTDVLRALERAVADHQGNQRKVAKAAGVYPPEISDTMRQKQLPSAKVLKFLGFEPANVYLWRGKK